MLQQHKKSEILIQQGLALHQQGNLREAQLMYEQAISMSPNNCDALHFLGILFAQTGQFIKAVDFLTKALQINPNNATYYSNYGNVLQELKNLDEALASYDRAVQINPEYAEAHFNRSITLQKLERLDEAIESYDRVISINSDLADAHFNRGICLQEIKRLDEAIESYDRVININSDYADAHFNRGICLQEIKRLDEAIACYDRVIRINPTFVEAYFNYGNTLRELKRFEEAIANYEKAIKIEPNYAEAYLNCGNVFREIKRLDKAISKFEKIIAINPNYAEAYLNYGLILEEFKRFDEAIANYEKAIAIKPDFAAAHWNLSLCNLLTGNFQDGWQNYEWRWMNKEALSFQDKRNFLQPLWINGETLTDKTILIYAEQGLGDTIQFCRYLPEVALQSKKVIFEVQRNLVKLFNNLGNNIQIIAKGDNLPSFDVQCPLLSLPLAYKTELHTIPPIPKVITSDLQKLTKWKTILGRKTSLRVGLAWSGNSIHKNDHNRSLSLSQLLSYLPPNIDYVCLQNELRDGDKELLERHCEIKYFGHLLEDFSDTAELCELMDIVISVDTSVAHLAGMLGKPTWVLLPFIPDWRWLLDRDDNPWYPSAKLYRQEKVGDWKSVLEKVKNDIGQNVLIFKIRQ
jgi:hypothetical protein